MGISINPKMSGFRKWAEIHDPKKIVEACAVARDEEVIAPADVDQESKAPDQQPHRPWLVPGAGRL